MQRVLIHADLYEALRELLVTGARVLCGGRAEGALLPPTLLEDVPADEPICCAEAFGPVAVLSRFTDFEQALEQVNDSVFGLQACASPSRT